MLWSKLISALAIIPLVIAKPIALQRKNDNGASQLSSIERRSVETNTYTIVSGDYGNLIAAVYSITFNTLSSANPNVNWNSLSVGQTIKMPSARLPTLYTTVSGDTLGSLAQRFNIYLDDLRTANPAYASTRLASGTKLRIPGYGAYTTYAITSGDYGFIIANAFGISFDTLSAANPGVNWNLLQIGQVLTVPAGVSPSTGTIPSPATAPPKTTTTTASTTAASTTRSTTSSSSSTSAATTTKSVTSTSVSSSSTTTVTTTKSVTSTSQSSTASSSGSITSTAKPTTAVSSSSTTSSTASKPTSSSVTTTSSTSSRSTTTTTTSTTSTIATGEPTVTPTTTVTGANYVPGGGANENLIRPDRYTFYKGDGSTSAGWPEKNQWTAFSAMWKRNLPYLGQYCQSVHGVANNSPEENQYIYNAIQAVSSASGVDHRLILASIMQESSGCVRVKTTTSPDGTVSNPGLMQTFNGIGSCNRNGQILNPCPASQIYQMIQDGTFGVSTDGGKNYYAGLVQDINSSPAYSGAQVIYRAVRIYNSGHVDSSNDLGKGGATACYASDMANRLTGWMTAQRTCTLDG